MHHPHARLRADSTMSAAGGAPMPPEPNKRRLTGEVVSFDARQGKGQLAGSNGHLYSFTEAAFLTHADRKTLNLWQQQPQPQQPHGKGVHAASSLHAEFSVNLSTSCAADAAGADAVAPGGSVSELVVRLVGQHQDEQTHPQFCGGGSSSAPSRGFSALQLEQEEGAMVEVDKLLLMRDDCDDPSLTRHPPMFQVFWELQDYARSVKQARTVPVVLVRTRLAMHTAIMSILSEKLSVGMDVVNIDEAVAASNPQMIVLSVCVGAGVFVFDLPKMHPPERDAVAMLLLSFGQMRPNVPLVTLSINNLRKLATGYPENFFACTPSAVGAVDVLQAAQQVLPQISQKARSPEELINMVFGYKHAPRPTRSEDAALSIAFGRPAFHSRQVFSQLNNLARNQAFAQLLDKQGREVPGERGERFGSISTTASGLAGEDASPSNASSQPATVNAYKRRRLASWNSSASIESMYANPNNANASQLLSQPLPLPNESTAEHLPHLASEAAGERGVSDELQFFQWIQNEINKQQLQQQAATAE